MRYRYAKMRCDINTGYPASHCHHSHKQKPPTRTATLTACNPNPVCTIANSELSERFVGMVQSVDMSTNQIAIVQSRNLSTNQIAIDSLPTAFRQLPPEVWLGERLSETPTNSDKLRQTPMARRSLLIGHTASNCRSWKSFRQSEFAIVQTG